MGFKYINPEYLDSVTGGDADVTKEIVGMFKEQVVETYDQMLKLLAEGDYYNLGQLAHKVKSSVAIMGMTDLAVMLKTFELQAKDGKESEKYASYIERFRTESSGAAGELDDMIRTRYS